MRVEVGRLDLEDRVCHVHHTLQRIQNPDRKPDEPKTCLHIGLPKNGKQRVIPLHDYLLGLLQKIQGKLCAVRLSVIWHINSGRTRTMENRFKKSPEKLRNP